MSLNGPTRAYRPDAQPFDEIHITTVPRYKQSGLSGDEWRISARVDFMRNGEVKHSRETTSVQYAAKFLAYYMESAISDGHAYFGGEGEYCDQEGCSNPATIKYRVKQHGCSSCGEFSKIYGEQQRWFCNDHRTRGDCGLDDADANYELVDEVVA